METKPKKIIKKKPVEKKDKNRYIEGIGRRKSAIARVRIYPSTNKPLKSTVEKDEAKPHRIDAKGVEFSINEKTINEYFSVDRLRQVVLAPLNVLSVTFTATVRVSGGGISAQADAIRLGLSRALNELNEKWRSPLKREGFLTVDDRRVERKHPGLRKARRPQQWRKR